MSVLSEKNIAIENGAGAKANPGLRSESGYDLTHLTESQKMKLAESLSAEEREIILHHGTERPYCGSLLNNKRDGVYVCRLCRLPLFRSETKFESGTGWPSFTRPFDTDHIRRLQDYSFGMNRSEIRCQRCDAHLGHVFPDGPPPTGERYCLNSIAMDFIEEELSHEAEFCE